MRRSRNSSVAGLIVSVMIGMSLQASASVNELEDSASRAKADNMDRDLLEISVPGLEALYAHHRYTVVQVASWYLDRIGRYDGTYRAILHLDKEGALRQAAEEDATPKGERHGVLWGVPIVVKANTSVKDWITSAGWSGYLKPGEELVASRDAMVVQRLREAG